ncbi:DUF3606 domain-containing protein [Terrihabitans sp. B22-R8]|uniref:DUF3606 domain-containing protein n=1 Tax=Terrihabitans sp. B22-R8 TaxID=3425128 RepID=UPI00403CDB27
MSSDNPNYSKSDNERVAAGQDHEVEYFARKHGITKEQTLSLIKQVGNKRTDLEAAVKNLKKA